MITYKPGAVVNKTGPLKHLLEVLESMPDKIVVTSGNDGKHAKNSYHYHDRAIDIRTWDRTLAGVETLLSNIVRQTWEKGYTALHIRVEIDGDKKRHYWYNGSFMQVPARGRGEHFHLEVR